MPYGMESNSSAIPAGIPFSSTKRSNEIGSRLTGCLGGVLTRHAATKPIVPDMSEQAKNRFKGIYVMHEKTNHRAEAHGCIVHQSIISYGFAATGRRGNVNYNCISRYGHHSKCKAVDNPQHDE